jgi:hypothetical protein
MSTPTLLKKAARLLDVMRKTKKANQNPRASLLASLLRVVAKKRNHDIALFLNPQMREKFFKQRERERCEHERKNFEKLV